MIMIYSTNFLYAITTRIDVFEWYLSKTFEELDHSWFKFFHLFLGPVLDDYGTIKEECLLFEMLSPCKLLFLTKCFSNYEIETPFNRNLHMIILLDSVYNFLGVFIYVMIIPFIVLHVISFSSNIHAFPWVTFN